MLARAQEAAKFAATALAQATREAHLFAENHSSEGRVAEGAFGPCAGVGEGPDAGTAVAGLCGSVDEAALRSCTGVGDGPCAGSAGARLGAAVWRLAAWFCLREGAATPEVQAAVGWLAEPAVAGLGAAASGGSAGVDSLEQEALGWAGGLGGAARGVAALWLVAWAGPGGVG